MVYSEALIISAQNCNIVLNTGHTRTFYKHLYSGRKTTRSRPEIKLWHETLISRRNIYINDGMIIVEYDDNSLQTL